MIIYSGDDPRQLHSRPPPTRFEEQDEDSSHGKPAMRTASLLSASLLSLVTLAGCGGEALRPDSPTATHAAVRQASSVAGKRTIRATAHMHPVSATRSLLVYAGQLVGNFDGDLVIRRNPKGPLFGFGDIEFAMSNPEGKIRGDSLLTHFTNYGGRIIGYYRGRVKSGTGSFAHVHASGLQFVSVQIGPKISISVEGTLAH
jgi:hypothetical protein